MKTLTVSLSTKINQSVRDVKANAVETGHCESIFRKKAECLKNISMVLEPSLLPYFVTMWPFLFKFTGLTVNALENFTVAWKITCFEFWNSSVFFTENYF